MIEQPIQRLKSAKRRKKAYSGKKKRDTSKVELVMAGQGKYFHFRIHILAESMTLEFGKQGDLYLTIR